MRWSALLVLGVSTSLSVSLSSSCFSPRPVLFVCLPVSLLDYLTMCTHTTAIHPSTGAVEALLISDRTSRGRTLMVNISGGSGRGA